MKNYLIFVLILFCASVGFIIFLEIDRKELAAEIIKLNSLNLNYVSQIDSNKKEIAEKIQQINSLKSQLSKQQSGIPFFSDDFFQNILTPTKAPAQSGVLNKISDCEVAVRQKYFDIRLEECVELGFENSSTNEMFRQLPDDCILPDALHNELYQKEVKDGKACGGSMFFPGNY